MLQCHNICTIRLKGKPLAHEGDIMLKFDCPSLCAAVLSVACTLPVLAQTTPKKEPTARQLAARERLAKCSAEWKDAKADGKLEPGMPSGRNSGASATRA